MYLVLQGIKRCDGVPQNSRLPITADILRVIMKALQNDIRSFKNVMLWAACNVVFRGSHRHPLYCFHFDFRYVTLVRYIYIYIYIYIICIPTLLLQHLFYTEIYIAQKKMATFGVEQLLSEV